MAISIIQGLSGIARIRSSSGASAAPKPYVPFDVDAQIELLRTRGRLLQLYRSLETLAEAANVNTRLKLDLPDALSSSGIGLDLTHTAATLASSNEINASPMSFTPFGPDWDDGSSALITIGGEYDGSHGSGALTFEVRRAGTRGEDNLRIRVEDPEGNRIRNVNIRRNHAEDRQYDLQNGLFLTLGPGSLINRDTTTIQVFDNVGAAVDPDKPLGGIRNDNPNLQFGGPSISDGAFQLNGASISVSTSDTLNDVVNRINQSTAGVTATFNALSERIEFLQETLGSQASIDLQNDTSNFLEATKLDSLNTIAGIDPETIQAFDQVASFSGVQSGDLVINGQQIALDTSADSLQTMLDKINASSAGVDASFDAATQKVLIESRDPDSHMDIDSNGTGFFTALNLPEGRVDPEANGRGISRRRSYQIADALQDTFQELNVLLGASGAVSAPLDGALRLSLAGDDMLGILGIGLDNRRAALDRRTLTRGLQLNGEATINVLRGSKTDAGLVERLLNGTRSALASVNSRLGLSGTFIDTYA